MFSNTLMFRGTVQIPKGHVWLQGDNTLNSTDSRAYGPVPYNLLQGRVFLKVRQSSQVQVSLVDSRRGERDERRV